MRNLYGTKKEEHLRRLKILQTLLGVVGAIGIMMSFVSFCLLFFLSAKSILELGMAIMLVSVGLCGVIMTFIGIILENVYGSEK